MSARALAAASNTGILKSRTLHPERLPGFTVALLYEYSKNLSRMHIISHSLRENCSCEACPRLPLECLFPSSPFVQCQPETLRSRCPLPSPCSFGETESLTFLRS